MDWSNPHVRLYLEVKEQSKKVIWELYLGSPNQQLMNGWKIDTYRRGDHVSVDTYPARDGSSIGFAKKVSVVSGRIFQGECSARPPNRGATLLETAVEVHRAERFGWTAVKIRIVEFVPTGDSGEAERYFRSEAERHSGMIPNTIGA
jgi:hypothetical protein